MTIMTRKYVPCGACGRRCPATKKDRWFANERGEPELLVEVNGNGHCIRCAPLAELGATYLRSYLMNQIASDGGDNTASRICLVLAWLERRARIMEGLPVRKGHIANIVAGDRMFRQITGREI